ncbi:hypothetical protein LPJ61_001752 [Coemansia biformis]|uniref:Extracellular membrane protein CFEM domain-containing protein n=1 Tax=Coemansia biformis TaxID=1286918 RepID=A0A9W7YGA5_9FUNG|nr:hypothetical protein LPJ61_001752 [Coemansia biformis]
MLSKLLLLAALALAVPGNAARPGSSGEEFVKACDSGSDDVTNQCINRIPEDIGVSSGNHACAYHEAEVRCLGLCGNTLTWKVAYNNALKRYRLVCASYIKDRIADKEEDEGPASSDDEDSASKSSKRRPSDDPPVHPKPQRPAAAKPAKDAKAKTPPAQSSPPSASASTSSAAKDAVRQTTSTVKTTIGGHPKTTTPSAAAGDAGEPRRGEPTPTLVHAMLPTMDPELAAAPTRAHALTLLALALAGAAAALHIA